MIFNDDEVKANARRAFAVGLPIGTRTQRTLRSLAFHLKIAIDIGRANNDELIVEIGKEFINKHGLPPDASSSTDILPFYLYPDLFNDLIKIATRQIVPESEFAFLLKFPKKSIKNKLFKTRIVPDQFVENSFRNAQSAEVVVGYLCDVSQESADHIANILMKLKYSIQVMEQTWIKQISWFADDENKEKLRAAFFYSNKVIPDQAMNQIGMIPYRVPSTVLMPVVEDFDDVEIFFHRVDLSSPMKVFVYEKIRGLYNTRSSRAENKKKRKNCSFILSPEAKSLIKILAEENRMKGKESALLELIFQDKNKEDLQRILTKRYLLTQR